MIFGPKNKSYGRLGDALAGPDGMFTRLGDTTFGPNGTSISKIGDTSFVHKNGGRQDTICRMGNTWHSRKGAYSLMGCALYGPHGRVWHNVRPEDVPTLIADDD